MIFIQEYAFEDVVCKMSALFTKSARGHNCSAQQDDLILILNSGSKYATFLAVTDSFVPTICSSWIIHKADLSTNHRV